MTGLIYKECKQNRFFLIATAVLPLLVFFLPAVILGKNNGPVITAEGRQSAKILFIIVGYLIAGAMQTSTYMGDDSKKWGYFIASGPAGVKGYIYTKYMLILGMCMLFVFSMEMSDILYGTFCSSVTEQPYISLSTFFIVLFYIQLFLRAIDMPFIVRFGIKQGSIIKIILFVATLLIMVIIFAASPSAMFAFSEAVENLTGNEPGNLMLVITGMFPYVSIGLFILSYKISCKLYMRGVEHYDK
ncbi:MAG: ABC-2 transporter permease [Lachnospiraceae bacterium]|nr:ABC-2 transporter permease [Lachnospiraceae bacterium]